MHAWWPSSHKLMSLFGRNHVTCGMPTNMQAAVIRRLERFISISKSKYNAIWLSTIESKVRQHIMYPPYANHLVADLQSVRHGSPTMQANALDTQQTFGLDGQRWYGYNHQQLLSLKQRDLCKHFK